MEAEWGVRGGMMVEAQPMKGGRGTRSSSTLSRVFNEMRDVERTFHRMESENEALKTRLLGARARLWRKVFTTEDDLRLQAVLGVWRSWANGEAKGRVLDTRARRRLAKGETYQDRIRSLEQEVAGLRNDFEDERVDHEQALALEKSELNAATAFVSQLESMVAQMSEAANRVASTAQQISADAGFARRAAPAAWAKQGAGGLAAAVQGPGSGKSLLAAMAARDSAEHHAAVSSAAATLVRDRLHALLAAIDPRYTPPVPDALVKLKQAAAAAPAQGAQPIPSRGSSPYARGGSLVPPLEERSPQQDPSYQSTLAAQELVRQRRQPEATPTRSRLSDSGIPASETRDLSEVLHEKFQAMDLNGDGLLEWASGEVRRCIVASLAAANLDVPRWSDWEWYQTFREFDEGGSLRMDFERCAALAYEVRARMLRGT